MNLAKTGRNNLTQWKARHKWEAWSDSMAADALPVALDFEFTRLPLPFETDAQWISRVEILSIGMAPGEGLPTLYASAELTPGLIKQCAHWTREHVVPLIDQRPVDARWSSDAEFFGVVSNYLSELEASTGRSLVMAADWQGDFLLLIQQLGSRAPRCAGVDLSAGSARQRSAPSWEGLIRHNALDDAIWLRRVLGFEPVCA